MALAEGCRLSVVIGAVGNVELTRRCVESVRELSALKPEIVLVDNGSTLPDSLAMARLGADVLLSHPRMLGYPAAINWGVREASGELICLLNNDAEVTQAGWDARLAAILEEVPRAAMVAPTSNVAYAPGQMAEGPVPSPSTSSGSGLGDDDGGSWVLETERLVFVCMMMRRALFVELGGLDERFGLGNWEDNDLCLRVRRAGGRLLVDPATWVRHVGHATMREVADVDLLARNEALFRAKWGTDPHPNPLPQGEGTLVTHDAR